MIRAVISTPVALISACHTLSRHRSLQYLYLRPYLLGLTLFLSLVSGAYIYREQIGAYISSEPGIIAFSVVIVTSVLSASVIAFLSLLITSELLLDSFLVKAFSLKGVEKGEGGGNLFRSAISSLLVVALRIVIISFLFILTLASFVLAPLVPVAWMLNVIYLGCELIISPLTALQLPYRKQFSLIKHHKLEVVLLGLLFTVILLIPFAGLFVLPLAYLTAIEKIVRWPELER